MFEKKAYFNILKTFTRLLNLLPKSRRKQYWVLFIGMVTLAGVETLTAGSFAVYVSILSDPKAVLKSSWLLHAQAFMGMNALTDSEDLIILSSIFVVGLVFCKNGLMALITYSSVRYSEAISAFFGEKLLKGFLRVPYEWHLNSNSADLVMAAGWRLHFGRFANSCIQVLRDFLIVIIMLTAILVVEPVVSMTVILVIGVSSVLIFSNIRESLDRTAVRTKECSVVINRNVTKSIHGIKDLKVLGRRSSFLHDYVSDLQKFVRLKVFQHMLSSAPVWILESLAFLMLATSVCIMLLALDSSTGKLTGTVALLAITAWRTLPAISRILSSLVQIRKSIPFVEGGFWYLEEIDKNIEKDGLEEIEDGSYQLAFNEEIRLEDVCFVYQGRSDFLLKKVNFCIKKGMTVGIIGISGAGKSTLVDIILGLLRPTEGKVTVDGRNLSVELRNAWLKKIGYVPQTPYICDGTIGENVAFGISYNGIDRDRVIESCRMAAMQNLLDELPQGIDTRIGERGMRLSGGQRQRVAIARALYRNPEVLIFDEATSSLDSKNERAIQETINGFKGRQTLIVIAHRLSTVSECDFLVWIEKGMVRKVGTPDEVLDEYRYGESLPG